MFDFINPLNRIAKALEEQNDLLKAQLSLGVMGRGGLVSLQRGEPGGESLHVSNEEEDYARELERKAYELAFNRKLRDDEDPPPNWEEQTGIS